MSLDKESNVTTKRLFEPHNTFKKINSSYNFNKFFKSNECGKILWGRMKSFSINGSEGILFTTSDSFRIKGTPNDKVKG